jgi:hypothetical protein
MSILQAESMKEGVAMVRHPHHGRRVESRGPATVADLAVWEMAVRRDAATVLVSIDGPLR